MKSGTGGFNGQGRREAGFCEMMTSPAYEAKEYKTIVKHNAENASRRFPGWVDPQDTMRSPANGQSIQQEHSIDSCRWIEPKRSTHEQV